MTSLYGQGSNMAQFGFLRFVNKSISLKGIGNKVKVNVSLTIESILDLNEVKSLMKVQIKLKVTWKDSRLEFRNVEKRHKKIHLAEKRELWLPSFIFNNTNNKTEASFDDDTSYGQIEINPNSRGKIAPLMELDNFKRFSGSDGFDFLKITFVYI